jgi:hypothetical protein
LFQLFHPIGGVAASEFSCAASREGATSRLSVTIRILVLGEMNLPSSGIFQAATYFVLDKAALGRLVDCRITSLGTIKTFRGRGEPLDAMR